MNIITRALTAALLVAAAPTLAAPTGAFYHAVLAEGQAPSSLISSDVLWQGSGKELTAKEAGLRAPMVCAELALNVGVVSSFTVEGVALAQDKLDFCNKHARKAK